MSGGDAQLHRPGPRLPVPIPIAVALSQREQALLAVCGSCHRTVWTTGRITLDPGAPGIIPGRAEMLFQIRDDDSNVVVRLEGLLQTMAKDVTAAGPCAVSIERIHVGVPAAMNASIQDAVEAAAEVHTPMKSLHMHSGAGRMRISFAILMPAGMLFVPSIGGISHHWTENASDEDIASGATVFVEACRRMLSDVPVEAALWEGCVARPRNRPITPTPAAGGRGSPATRPRT
ncbi:MAG: putative N-carbamoyl-L-amino acid hydrolase [Xanthobacteraceae bacterium]|nr:MAG: putative N-carbamoyl-L-amino acid hydrolase [Xanthobacteraceae bacterium]